MKRRAFFATLLAPLLSGTRASRPSSEFHLTDYGFISFDEAGESDRTAYSIGIDRCFYPIDDLRDAWARYPEAGGLSILEPGQAQTNAR